MGKLKEVYFKLFAILFVLSLFMFFMLEAGTSQRQVSLITLILSLIMCIVIGFMVRSDKKKTKEF